MSSIEEILIRGLMKYADDMAGFMEGAGMPEFKIYEDKMCWAIELLKQAGVDYNPITGVLRPVGFFG